eukprot:6184285-Pleurochrysis_carterae.AAC.1
MTSEARAQPEIQICKTHVPHVPERMIQARSAIAAAKFGERPRPSDEAARRRAEPLPVRASLFNIPSSPHNRLKIDDSAYGSQSRPQTAPPMASLPIYGLLALTLASPTGKYMAKYTKTSKVRNSRSRFW